MSVEASLSDGLRPKVYGLDVRSGLDRKRLLSRSKSVREMEAQSFQAEEAPLQGMATFLTDITLPMQTPSGDSSGSGVHTWSGMA